MESVTVTIGRNVGNTPMDMLNWETFKSEVRDAVRGHVDIWADAEYKGEWLGVEEDARIFWGVTNRPPKALDHLRNDLSLIAGRYDQDAVGFTLGEAPQTVAGAHELASV